MNVDADINEKRRKEKEEHSVATYESRFKQIERISGEQHLDRLAQRFIQSTWQC
jgi:hypothetical protein